MATLRRVADKQATVFHRHLMEGLQTAANLHLRLAAQQQNGRCTPAWSLVNSDQLLRQLACMAVHLVKA